MKSDTELRSIKGDHEALVELAAEESPVAVPEMHGESLGEPPPGAAVAIIGHTIIPGMEPENSVPVATPTRETVTPTKSHLHWRCLLPTKRMQPNVLVLWI